MRHLTWTVLTVGLLAAASGRALAQDDAGSGDGSGSGSASGDATAAGDGSGSAETTPVVVSSGLATQIADRPLVLSKGLLEVHAFLPITQISITIGGMTSSSTGIGLGAGVNYGVADKIEAGVDYAISLKDFDAAGPLNVHAAYLASTSEKLDIALAALFHANLGGGNDVSINLAGWIRYKINPMISVFTGQPALQSGFGTGYHLGIGLNNGNPVALQLPVGVGLQATPQLFAYLSTNIANINIHPSGGSTVIFADTIPFTLGAFFSPSNKLDVGVQFQDDLKNGPFDVFIVTLAARAYL